MSLAHRILWLDDDLESVRTYVTELDTRKYSVKVVSSKKDFEESLLEPWDLLILDLQLGELWGGLDVLAEFKRFDNVTPVLVCTGQGAKREVKAAFELAAEAVIFKEDIPDQLAKVVESLVDPYSRFPLILERFSTPLAYLGRRFLESESSLQQLRLAFDFFEILTKLIMVNCFAELERFEQWDGRLRTQMQRRILNIPSLGDWVRCIEMIASGEIDQRCATSARIKRAVRSQQLATRLSEAVRARNTFTHGVTPSEPDCEQYIRTWWPVIFKFLIRCTPVHTNQMFYVESLERNRSGYRANGVRLIGSSSVLKRDSINCEESPFTGQISVTPYGSNILTSIHPWLRLHTSEASTNSILIYDKVLVSSSPDGQKVQLSTDKIEYIDVLNSRKIKTGQFSEFVDCHPSLGLISQI